MGLGMVHSQIVTTYAHQTHTTSTIRPSTQIPRHHKCRPQHRKLLRTPHKLITEYSHPQPPQTSQNASRHVTKKKTTDRTDTHSITLTHTQSVHASEKHTQHTLSEHITHTRIAPTSYLHMPPATPTHNTDTNTETISTQLRAHIHTPTLNTNTTHIHLQL